MEGIVREGRRAVEVEEYCYAERKCAFYDGAGACRVLIYTRCEYFHIGIDKDLVPKAGFEIVAVFDFNLS